MSGLSAPDSYRYQAYVSYSHHDEKWAVWLHRKLEAYRVPRRLVGRKTPAGIIPRRIAPVFRDREELATATDLGETVNQALRDSANLVVICSPDATKSRWVNEEILTFKRLGRAGRIFCLIVAGEPIIERSPEAEIAGCFPDALRYAEAEDGRLANLMPEPIAADAREGKDGRTDALLKLVAGIIGVGFDELKRRELHRRHFRMTAVTTVALCVMLLTTFLAVRATVAEREALHNRTQAESLISFMLGDLHAKLEPVGRLDVLDAVGDKAIDYYDSVDEQSMTPAALVVRSAAMRQIGEVRMAQGRLDQAMDAFYRALADAEKVLAESPDTISALFQLGQAQFGIAYAHRERSEFPEMRYYLEEYLETSRELVQREPGNEDWLLELSYAYTNLGIVSYTNGDADDALDYFRRAQAIAETLASRHPDDLQRKFALAGAVSWVASARSATGDLEGALESFRNEIALKSELASADPRNTLWLRRLSLAHRRAGEILEAMGRLDEASGDYAKAFDISERLASPAFDPDNTNWRRDLAVLHAALGRIALANGLASEAKRQFEQHNQIIASMLPENTGTMRWHTDLATGRVLLGKALGSLGEFELAQEAAHAAIDELEQLLSIHPDDREAQRQLSEAYLLRGELFVSDADTHAAIDAWSRSLNIIESLAEGSNDYRILYVWMRVLLDLDRVTEANRVAERLSAMGFANPTFVDLCNSNGLSANLTSQGE